MRAIATFILILLSFVFTVSCANDDDCTPITLEILSLETEYSCINTPYQMDIDLTEAFIIIRNQSVFDNLVSGSCMPQIDFEAYDVLIGKKGLTSGIERIDYEGLIENCETGQLSLTITFVRNATTEAPNLTYHVLVPKLEANDVINVSIITL